MGHVDVAGVRFELPDGRVLLDDVSLRVGEGAKVALVGANGAGKTTLLRIVTGDLVPHAGAVTRSGGLGVMRQFVGHGVVAGSDDPTVADLLLSVAPARVRQAHAEVDACELALMEIDDEATQMRYASALAEYADAGGYDLEVTWDVCTTAAMGVPFDRARYRSLRTLSGGEQKRLVLEYLLRGPDEVLLLDEPDNYLDVPGKIWLEERIRESDKTILFICHDRELLANTATRIVTVELGSAGNRVWTHPGGFASYHEARRDRFARFEELRRRWDEEHAKIKALVLMYKKKAAYNDGMASRYQAAQTRLRKFEEAGPPTEQPREQQVTMRLKGGRTGKRAVVCERLELTGLMKAVRPRGLVRRAGRRARLQRLGQVALPAAAGRRRLRPRRRAPARRRGPDRAGRPHRPRPARCSRAARLVRADPRAPRAGRPHAAGDPAPRRPPPRRHGPRAGQPGARPLRAGGAAEQRFESLSGGQQARFQILLLELSGATLLLLDEPTDNLDVESAEALEDGLEAFEGTVLAVTHDRWFARGFDRFLVFGADGEVYESDGPVWDEGRVQRVR